MTKPTREQMIHCAEALEFGGQVGDFEGPLAVAARLRELAEVEWPSGNDLCRCAERLEHVGEEADLKYFDGGMFRRVAAMLRKLAG